MFERKQCIYTTSARDDKRALSERLFIEMNKSITVITVSHNNAITIGHNSSSSGLDYSSP